MVNGNGAYVPDNTFQKIEVAESPFKFCNVPLSDVIASGKRLDAQKYDINLRAAQERVLNSKFGIKHITGNHDGLCTAYRPGICKRVFVEQTDDALEMFTPSQILDIFPKAEKYLSKKFCKSIPDWFVKKGEILLTCSGTIGNISLVSKTLDNKCISQNLIRIVPKNSEDLGYVYAYLKSCFGQLFLTRNNYGAVIKHIDPDHLATILIPDAPSVIRRRINNLIVGSYELRDESNDLINEAMALLVKELQFPDIRNFKVSLYKKKAEIDSFSVKLSNLMGRVDASYHVPIVNAIVEHMKKFAAEVTTISDKRLSKDVVLPGRFKRVYVEEEYGVKFLGGKVMHQLDPTSEKYLSRTAHKKQLEGALGIKENSILTPARGSLGDVVLASKQFFSWAISDNMMQILSNKEICGYLYIFLNTAYGRELIKRFTYGGVVDAIEPEHIKKVEVPLLRDAEVQRHINDLALEANEKRYEAYLMEQQAMRIINDEVIFAK